MVILRAKGKKNGEVVSVVCKCQDGKKPVILFNGERNWYYELHFTAELEDCHVMGGTYCPKENEPLNVYNVLENYFFDSSVKVQVEGKMPTIPYRKGMIY